jgi:beta-glucanase (GH16 family)
MLLNLAIGGTAGGDPSETEFPARLEVDYVRVYQKPAPEPAAAKDILGETPGPPESGE